jgi:SPP1 gp7 family putative phage head morphogenesis protein
MTNREYWQGRATQRLLYSEELGQRAIVPIVETYNQSLRRIDSQIKSLYENYSKKGILDTQSLQKAIGNAGSKQFLRDINETAEALGLDPDKIFDKRYLARLTRLQAFQEQIKLEVMRIAPVEEKLSGKAYNAIIEDTYESMQFDLASQGINPSFSNIDKGTAETIMKAHWVGGNYSTRVWNNVGGLALELPVLLGGDIAAGQSYQKTAKTLRDRYKVKAYQAVRLVRTETNHFHGQSELQSYIDDGILRYRFEAILDNDTSKICRHLNGRVYLVAEAVPGLNYHPMHGNCRSTSVPMFEGETALNTRSTRPDRTERFDKLQEENLQDRWQKAMQQQMNPDKANHDYNADMNILTQNYKGEELHAKIDTLMAKIPEDDPLRPALTNVAKLHGWKEGLQKTLPEAISMLEEPIDLFHYANRPDAKLSVEVADSVANYGKAVYFYDDAQRGQVFGDNLITAKLREGTSILDLDKPIQDGFAKKLLGGDEQLQTFKELNTGRNYDDLVNHLETYEGLQAVVEGKVKQQGDYPKQQLLDNGIQAVKKSRSGGVNEYAVYDDRAFNVQFD